MSDLPYSPVELACFARDYADIEWMLHISSPGRDRVITTDAFGEPLTPIEAFRWTHRVNSLSIEDDPADAEDWQAAIKQATTEFIKTRGTDNATPAEPTRIEAVVTLRKADDR